MASENPSVNEKSQTLDLAWAEDVLRASEYLGRSVPKSKLKTSRCAFLHDWAGNPENTADFVKNMVPKAQDTMLKHKKPEESPELIVAEKRSISELKALLAQALGESQLVMP